MRVVIVGDGGHSKVVQEMVNLKNERQIVAILDDKYGNKIEVNDIVFGPLPLIHHILDHEIKVIIAIGNNLIRKKVVSLLNLRAEQFLTIIHSTAVVSSTARVGNGTVIMPNVVINAETTIGDHCIINTGAIVEHESVINDYAHISPSATLTGNVHVGEGVNIGAGATIIPGIRVDKWSVIGAGSTVIKHIPAGCKAVGSPARILKNNQQDELYQEKVVVSIDKA
ncbi:acetyltransferase [Aquibacillus halophilus]|uniref:Acetyltransferase n=1 Tax=Aquibacillus halophilus TaxID=930132 RepID=A0A6A8DAB5_9BACI|nr:acetyltransferase [Aquibacillus halophilus]MRH42693.1 acetyltransferase [Aquibacillus halophilus]